MHLIPSLVGPILLNGFGRDDNPYRQGDVIFEYTQDSIYRHLKYCAGVTKPKRHALIVKILVWGVKSSFMDVIGVYQNLVKPRKHIQRCEEFIFSQSIQLIVDALKREFTIYRMAVN